MFALGGIEGHDERVDGAEEVEGSGDFLGLADGEDGSELRAEPSGVACEDAAVGEDDDGSALDAVGEVDG